jgi:hypothetical protein
VHYFVAMVAVLGIVVVGSQLLLIVPEGWPSIVVAVLTFLAAASSGRYILRRARR